MLLHPTGGMPAPTGWSSAPDTGGLPLWRWAHGQVCAATTDPDLLRFLAVTPARFDEMTAEELHAYLHGSPGAVRRRAHVLSAEDRRRSENRDPRH